MQSSRVEQNNIIASQSNQTQWLTPWLTSDRSPLSCWEICLRLSVDDSALQTQTYKLSVSEQTIRCFELNKHYIQNQGSLCIVSVHEQTEESSKLVSVIGLGLFFIY